MDNYLVPGDIPEDAIISRRSPASVVFRLKPIYRDDDVYVGVFSPFRREGQHRAGYDLYFYSQLCQRRYQ